MSWRPSLVEVEDLIEGVRREDVPKSMYAAIVVARYLLHYSLEEVGSHFQITRERVRQIEKKFGPRILKDVT